MDNFILRLARPSFRAKPVSENCSHFCCERTILSIWDTSRGVTAVYSETVTDNDFATVLYYPQTGIIHHAWKQYCHGKDFQDIMMASTRHLQKEGGTKWLSDDTNYAILTEEDALWGRKIWFYEAIRAGWKHWAIILPTQQIGKVSISDLVTEYRAAGINSMIFDNVPEAMIWLEAQ